MNLFLDLKLLALIGLANAAPLLAKRILGPRLAFPVDGSITLSDGQPVLGRSKSIRGIVLSLIMTTAAAPLIAIGWRVGAVIGATAMFGDVFSSFAKRRLRLAPSSMALGLDQLPESLFPATSCSYFFAMSFYDIAAIVAVFFVLELVVSRLLHRLRLRDTPY